MKAHNKPGVPFIIEDSKKMFYYRGLSEWESERGYLTDTCLDGQDTFKKLIYLEEKGFADFDALVNAAADAEKRFYDLRAAIKTAEARMGEIQTLRTHIMNYSRTRSVYTGYRKAGYSKKYLAEHEGDILIHKLMVLIS